MIEAPEARLLCEQLNKTVCGKRITDVFAQYTPHKFAWFYGKPEECAERLVGKTIDKACPQGGMVELTAGDTMLVLTDGVNLRYFEPGAKLPSKHQLLVAFADECCLLASVRMYGALLCFTRGHFDAPLAAYYETARTKPQVMSDAFDKEQIGKYAGCTEEIGKSFSGHGTDNSRHGQRSSARHPVPCTYPSKNKDRQTGRRGKGENVRTSERDTTRYLPPGRTKHRN